MPNSRYTPEEIIQHLRTAEIADQDTRDIDCFPHNSAWRSGEAKTLEWRHVDAKDWVIRLSRENGKTKHPRTRVLEGELKEIIARRLARRPPDCPLVFHRNGRPIKSFQKAFKSACERVGLDGMLVHDMRRSAIRNFTKAGWGNLRG